MIFNTRRAFAVFVVWLVAVGGVEIYQTNRLAQIDTIIEPLCVTPSFEEACAAALKEAEPANIADLCRLTAEILRDEHQANIRCVARS